MWWLDQIVSYLASIRDWFLEAYYEVQSWVWPFNNLAGPLYQLYYASYYICYYFGNFNSWVTDTANRLAAILDWNTIQNYIRGWFPNLDDVISWFYNWWGNVTSAITSWWSSTQYTVQGWIASAVSFLQGQLNTLSSLLAGLQSQISELLAQLPSFNEMWSWFTDWWSNALKQIIAWGALKVGEITGLIDSAFLDREPFWEGWQDWRDQVTEFFTDPWQWFYDRLEDLFDRFW